MEQQLHHEAGNLIDVRGPRFGAAITTVVLAAAIIVQGTVGTVLLAFQFTMFTIAAFAGLRWSPYGNLFKLVRKTFDLGPPPATEPEAPPRFSQLMGFIFTGGGLLSMSLGAVGLGWVLAGIVLALSGLLASTGLCVGCEVYLLGKRVLGAAAR
ncbi:MAG: DUF4395 domain-containing protein [Nitriliruptorales bacterium]|nr:DUF4395 domain-containing protein [Nitriliruptorales bacterium]